MAVVRALAGLLALNRVAFGIAYLAAPRRAAESWIGRAARSQGTQVFTRALGARDLALGAGALHARNGRRVHGDRVRRGGGVGARRGVG